MPKKPTEKQLAARKAFGAAAKKRAEEARNKKLVDPEPNDVQQVASEVDVASLTRQIEELKNSQALLQAALLGQQGQRGARATNRGLIGTHEKYLVDPAAYPNPAQRLSEEKRLTPFAFGYNYEFAWEVKVSEYETIDGLRMREPKFNIDLLRIVLDEDGNQTNGRYIVRRMVFHEDPQAAIVIARENGLSIDESNEKLFLDEMRYLRVRDWLLGIFYPVPAKPHQARKEMVLDNRLVEFFEINSETSAEIPFDKLKTKV